MPASKQRILLLLLEFPTWLQSRGCSYSAQLSLEEGLSAQGIEYRTITTPWFDVARELCRRQRFDQVWVEIARHEELPAGWMDWVAEIAPVRVGFTVESLQYSEEEYRARPQLRGTLDRFLSRLPYVTHAVTCDERDAEEVSSRHGKPALWWPQAVPRRFVADEPVVHAGDRPALFAGGIYGVREKWLASEELSRCLQALPSPEAGTDLPARFDRVHRNMQHFFQSRKLAPFRRGRLLDGALEAYIRALRRVRIESFRLWLHHLRNGCAVVNLPHLVKTYAGRVVEAMAAGVPVLSWEIPDRPRNRALFESEKHLLFFAEDEPLSLAHQIERVQKDAGLARTIAANAQRNLLEFHTTEKRVAQILEWIETGAEPVYC